MSAALELSLVRQLGAFRLNARLSLGQEIGVLFGPSGAGKSLLLRLIAGLEKPDEGTVTIEGRCVADASRSLFVPARDRRVGMVFQNLALFPHMTALDNVRYGLRGEEAEKSRNWLARMHLEGMEGRYPHQMSGGQRQRVALARALAAEPALLLLDEPFSALDTPLRRSLRRELKSLQRETGVPVLYVTHAIDDVCSLGDRVFPIELGTLRDSLPVGDLWKKPTDASLCRLLGWGNCIAGTTRLDGEGPVLEWAGGTLTLPPFPCLPETASVFVAPSDVKLLYPGIPVAPELAANIFDGTVAERVVLGSHCRLLVDTGKALWQMEFPLASYESIGHEEGDAVRIAIPEGAIHLLGQSNGACGGKT